MRIAKAGNKPNADTEDTHNSHETYFCHDPLSIAVSS